jgi:hypothetical protein
MNQSGVYASSICYFNAMNDVCNAKIHRTISSIKQLFGAQSQSNAKVEKL